jgi:dTDP-4-amino-4,6-dideoxygalactose transaminase
MVATAAAIHFSGATPVPVEAGPDHLMDPKKLEAAITSRTRAIMPTQLNGRATNMDSVMGIAKKHGLDVYEGAAQALGSKFKGQCAGTFGKASCISFYPAKVLGCFGDGGAVLTNDLAGVVPAHDIEDLLGRQSIAISNGPDFLLYWA